MENPLTGIDRWIYHLGDVDPDRAGEIARRDAGLVVIDRESGDGRYGPGDLAAMRGDDADRLIVSYLSIGEAETYRDYWQPAWDTAPPGWLDARNENFTDNLKVRYWDPEWQAIILPIVDEIVDQGFDGLYLDIVTAFEHFEETDPEPGRDYRADMAAFVAAIRARAEARLAATDPGRPFAIIGQNGVELIDTPGYADAIDGIGQEDLRFLYDDPDRELEDFRLLPDEDYDYRLEYLRRAEAGGEEVFVVEYLTAARQAEFADALAGELADLTASGMPLYLAEHRDLDALYDQGAIAGEPPPAGVVRVGTPGDDSLVGGPGDDRLTGLAGEDTLVGGEGQDTAVFSGIAGESVRGFGPGGVTIEGEDGTDLLIGIERAVFDDAAYLFDLGGEAVGQVYRLYQAAFDRIPDETGLRFWTGLLESGTLSLAAIAGGFADSVEFATLFETDGDDEAFVTALYDNVLERAPDRDGLAFWIGRFASGEASRADMLRIFSESAENIERNVENLDEGIYVEWVDDLG